MAKVSVVTPERAQPAPLPRGFAGTARAQAYLADPRTPIHLHLMRLAAGDELTIGPLDVDCAAFVWAGAVMAGGVTLAAGSSAIAERGAQMTLHGAGEAEALVLCFAASAPSPTPLAGGTVHLLPAGRVPHLAADPGGSGVSGALHADADCPGCTVWLHENHFPGGTDLTPEQAALGVHSHSEAEIIFVTAGAMRLGTRLVGPGTALAIAADTMYGFTAGPEGLGFVNFRADRPSDIRFANGTAMSETGYWRTRVARPAYLSPLPAESSVNTG